MATITRELLRREKSVRLTPQHRRPDRQQNQQRAEAELHGAGFLVALEP